MDETLANLMIILKTVGLNESKTGLRELEGVLKATGLSVDSLASVLNKSAASLEHVTDLARSHAQANRDAQSIIQSVMTAQEKLNAQYDRLESAKPHLTVEQYTRALNQLDEASHRLADNQAIGRFSGFVPLGDVEKSADQSRVEGEKRQREQINNLLLQKNALVRQLETPEEAHVRRQQMYLQLLNTELNGQKLITKELYERAVQQSQTAMRMQMSLGGKGGGLAAGQLGFAVQDFATVMAMGGENALGRAFMSASNNLGQLVMVAGALNPVMASLVATGVTLAAVLGPKLWESMSGGIDKVEDSASRLKRTLDDIANNAAMERLDAITRQSIARFGAASSSSLRSSSDSLRNQIEVGQIDVNAARDRADAIRKSIREKGGDPALADREKFISDYVSAVLQGGSPASGFGGMQERAAKAARQAEEVYATRLQEQQMKMQEMTRGSEELRAAEEELAKLTAELAAKRDELAAAEKALADRLRIEAQQRFAAEQTSLQGVGEQASRNIGRMLVQSNRQAAIAGKTATSQQFQMGDAITEFFGNLINDPNLTPEARRDYLGLFGRDQMSQIDSEIANLRGQSRGPQAGIAGVSDFGRTLQLSLLKPEDEAKKQRDRQIKLLEDTKGVLQDQLTKLIDKFGVGE